MVKQQTVETSLGQLTVSSLTLGDLRQLDSLLQEPNAGGVASLFKYLPMVARSISRNHPEVTSEQLEQDLTLDDFEALFSAVLEISGLKKAPAGEFTPVPV